MGISLVPTVSFRRGPRFQRISDCGFRLALVVIGAVVIVLLASLTVVASGSVTATADEVEWSHAATTSDENVSIASQEGEGMSDPIELLVLLEDAEISDDLDESAVEFTLVDHAETTQEPLLAEVERRDGVEAETTFWMTNAVLVEVEHDEFDPEWLAEVEHVEGVIKNAVIEPLEAIESVDESPGTGGYDEGVHPGEMPLDAHPDRTRTTWGVEAIGAPAVWDEYNARGEGVRVAVLDTGIDVDHPDLDLYSADPGDPTYPEGWAEFDGTGQRVEGSTPYDSASHGTHVSGIVGGGNASGQYVGVAPEADLLSGLVISGQEGSLAQLLAGMEWAVESDADVISMSLGVDGRVDPLVDPIRHAEASGVTVVAAIGNDGHGTSGSPGNVYEALSIGAIDDDQAVASFSGGEHLDREEWETPPDDWPERYTVPSVVAPGVRVFSTMPEGSYGEQSGTSMATPHVSGSMALLLSIDDELEPSALRQAIRSTAWKPAGESEETDDRYGDGIVDVKEAIQTHAAATLEGTVTTEDGSPIENATVFVDDRAVQTDVDGSYRLSVRAGERTVVVSADGYLTTERSVELIGGTATQQDVRLSLAPGVEPHESPTPTESTTVPLGWPTTVLRTILATVILLVVAACGWLVGRRVKG